MITSPLCTTCGKPFISPTGTDRPCSDCTLKKPPFQNARSAIYYEENAIRAIHRFKYHGDTTLTGPLIKLLALAASPLIDRETIIMPVPLHKKRLQKRGFNQALLLARALSKQFSLRLDYSTLKRIRHTAPQVDLGGKERQENVKKAFEIKGSLNLKSQKILLIDDVYTTGSTITECAKILKKAGATVNAATLARATPM